MIDICILYRKTCIYDVFGCKYVSQARKLNKCTLYRSVESPGTKLSKFGTLVVTFRVSRIDDAKCVLVTRVCVSVCLPSPHSHTTARTRMQLGGMVGDAP